MPRDLVDRGGRRRQRHGHRVASYTLAAGQSVECCGPICGGTTAINLTGNELAKPHRQCRGQQLDGQGGDDTLARPRRRRHRWPAAGNDVYCVDDAGDVVVEAAGEGSDTVFASASYTLGAGARSRSCARPRFRDDAIDLADEQRSSATAANTLIGNGGNNTLDGGAGADTMAGGPATTPTGSTMPAIVVIEAAGEGTDTVYRQRQLRAGGRPVDRAARRIGRCRPRARST